MNHKGSILTSKAKILPIHSSIGKFIFFHDLSLDQFQHSRLKAKDQLRTFNVASIGIIPQLSPSSN